MPRRTPSSVRSIPTCSADSSRDSNGNVLRATRNASSFRRIPASRFTPRSTSRCDSRPDRTRIKRISRIDAAEHERLAAILRRAALRPHSRYRRCSGLVSPSNFDASRCPRRQSHVSRLGLRPLFASRRRAAILGSGEGWIREDDDRRAGEALHATTSTPQNIIAYVADSPLDIERVLRELSEGRSARRRTLPLSIRLAPADSRSRTEHCAGRRSAVSRRAVPASGRRRLRSRTRYGDEDVRRPENQFR